MIEDIALPELMNRDRKRMTDKAPVRGKRPETFLLRQGQ